MPAVQPSAARRVSLHKEANMPDVTPRTAPEYIRAAAAAFTQPTSLIANALLRHEHALRTMCFMDNEYGPRANSDVFIIAHNVVAAVNTKYAALGRRIRVLNVGPLQLRHHHIVVDYGELSSRKELVETKRLVLNLYPLSKRKGLDDADGEDEEDGSEPKVIGQASKQRISAPSRGQGRRGNKMTMKEFADACAEEVAV